ncbi:MAG: hypothetical protein HZB95_02695 [Nitrosomonadales bacterium]|nr:hypothetical protein [Nitrosomonadales bacterium]
MIEYIFFDAALRDKFVSYARQHDVPCNAVEDNLGLVVEVSEDIPEEISDKLEEYYEALEDEQTSLSKAEGDLKRLAGFRFNLPNGESRMLPLQTEVANRLLVHFTLAEIQALFENVARCTLDPNDEQLCHILAAQEKKD